MLNIGVIGCGAIGRDHIRRLTDIVPGCQVVACADYFEEAAIKVAAQYEGMKAYKTGEELIAAPEVQAVVITSSDPSHAGYVLEALKAGKQVFCEKPLAQSAADCEKIIAAETAPLPRLSSRKVRCCSSRVIRTRLGGTVRVCAVRSICIAATV